MILEFCEVFVGSIAPSVLRTRYLLGTLPVALWDFAAAHFAGCLKTASPGGDGVTATVLARFAFIGKMPVTLLFFSKISEWDDPFLFEKTLVIFFSNQVVL